MWLAQVEIASEGVYHIAQFRSTAKDEKVARRSILRRAIKRARGAYPEPASLEATILDIRLDEPSEFRLF